MKRRLAAVMICLSALAGLSGCSSILDGDKGPIITAHQEPVSTASESIIEASTFEELKTDILDFVSNYEDTGMIRAVNYEGDIEKDVPLACDQIKNDDPLGAYAVSEITGNSTKIVTYFQVDISITYRITKEEINAIIPVSTIRLLQTDLEDKLSEYAPSMVVRAKGITLTSDDAMRYVKEIYYDNPMDIVMLPVTTVEFYPSYGQNQIAAFTFGYTRYEPITLKAMGSKLKTTVQDITESVSGNDAAILISFCRHLMDTVEYDTYTPASGESSDQNTAATAYGALINGSAVSEGYAMAYKALCDELGLNCYVVLGARDGKMHAWNIVELDGDYYHIDVSMSDAEGIETSFLLSDAKMAETYTWDRAKYKVCDGPLTYESVADSISTSASAGASANASTETSDDSSST